MCPNYHKQVDCQWISLIVVLFVVDVEVLHGLLHNLLLFVEVLRFNVITIAAHLMIGELLYIIKQPFQHEMTFLNIIRQPFLYSRQLSVVGLDDFISVLLRWSNHSTIYRNNCSHRTVDIQSITTIGWVMYDILSIIHHFALMHHSQTAVAFSNLLRFQGFKPLGQGLIVSLTENIFNNTPPKPLVRWVDTIMVLGDVRFACWWWIVWGWEICSDFCDKIARAYICYYLCTR